VNNGQQRREDSGVAINHTVEHMHSKKNRVINSAA